MSGVGVWVRAPGVSAERVSDRDLELLNHAHEAIPALRYLTLAEVQRQIAQLERDVIREYLGLPPHG